MCEKLHIMSSNERGFLDKPYNTHVNPYKTSVLSLDYAPQTLKMGGYWLESEDDVCSSELAVIMEEDLGF